MVLISPNEEGRLNEKDNLGGQNGIGFILYRFYYMYTYIIHTQFQCECQIRIFLMLILKRSCFQGLSNVSQSKKTDFKK